MSHFEDLKSYIPFDLFEPGNFLLALLVTLFFILFRYFLVVGAFYFTYWKNWIPKAPGRKLYETTGRGEQIKKEIFWSSITSVIFALAGVVTGLLWQAGYTKIYLRFDEYPLWYLPVSLILMSLVHEAYFYWSHRVLHFPWLFRKAHYVHHLSLQPSPWASFSFHPIEAFLEALILPLMVCVIPVHPVVFIIYLTLMTISAVNNHLGFELMPNWAQKLGLHRVLISGENHSVHHKLGRYNFGLYYTFMDQWFNTLKK